MATKLFETTDRRAAHAELERLLAAGGHPRAECREDANAEAPYSVWDDAEARAPTPAPALEPANLRPAEIQSLAKAIAEMLRKDA
jgi:hypothetical protein